MAPPNNLNLDASTDGMRKSRQRFRQFMLEQFGSLALPLALCRDPPFTLHLPVNSLEFHLDRERSEGWSSRSLLRARETRQLNRFLSACAEPSLE